MSRPISRGRFSCKMRGTFCMLPVMFNVFVLQTGRTDTLAALAGALSGAHLGVSAIPPPLLRQLEDGPKGRTYFGQLAARLYEWSGWRSTAASSARARRR
jgi:hypothetical protein